MNEDMASACFYVGALTTIIEALKLIEKGVSIDTLKAELEAGEEGITRTLSNNKYGKMLLEVTNEIKEKEG